MNGFNFPGSAMLSDEEINTFARGLPVPMGVYEARDYLQWTNDMNLNEREVRSMESINRFRATTGALPGSIGEVSGPAGTMLIDTSKRPGESEVLMSTVQQPRQPRQQQPASVRLGDQDVQMQNVAVAVARSQIASQRALESPKAVMDALRDSMSIRVKAELGRKSASQALDLSGARGDRKMNDAIKAESYNPARDDETIDRLFAISRGTTVDGLKSTQELDRGLHVLYDLPEYAIDPNDYLRATRLLSGTSSGQAVIQQLNKITAAAEVSFMSRIAETQPKSTEEYLRVAKEEYGPMYKVMLPRLLESMPESVKQGDKIKEFEAKKREWTDDVILATGKDIVFAEGKMQFVDVPKETLEEMRRTKTAQRIASGFGSVDLQSSEGRTTAARAGVISENQRIMLEELEKPADFEPVIPESVTKDAPAGAGASRLAPQDIPSVAEAAFRAKLDGSKEDYRTILANELNKLGDAIIGEDAYRAALAEAEDAYKSLVQSDARRTSENFTAAGIARMREADTALKDRSARFVSNIKDDGRIELVAQRMARGGFTDTEINNEAWQIVAKDLNLGQREIEMYQAMRYRPDVNEVMPEIHRAFTAARSAIDAKVGEQKAKEYADLSKRITELSAKWNTYSPQQRAQIEYFSGITTGAGPLSPDDLTRLAEGAKRRDELTLKVADREVGVFASPEQKQVADTFIASSKNPADALRALKTFFPADPKTGIMGITVTPMGSMIETIYQGGFNALFEAPTSPMSGAMGRGTGLEVFTEGAKQKFVKAQKEWAATVENEKGVRKFDPSKHYPEGMKDADGPWAEMYRNAAEAGDSFQMQAAYVGYLLENDANLHQRFEDAVGELTGVLVAGGYATAVGRGFQSTKDFDELLDAVRSADNFDDPNVVIARNLLRTVSEKEDVIGRRIESLKSSGVVYDERPAMAGRSDVLRTASASQRQTPPPNPATAIKTQLEQALKSMQPAAQARREREWWDERNRRRPAGEFEEAIGRGGRRA